MTCPHCGTQLPENSNVCPNCGTALSPTFTTAVGTSNMPLKKRSYLWKAASVQIKLFNKIALGIGALCLILTIVAAYTVVHGSVTNIPLLRMAVGEEEISELEEITEEALEKINDALEDDDDDLIEEFEDEYDLSIKDIQKAFDPLSMSSLVEVGPELTGDSEDYEIIGMIITFVNVYAAVIVLITALAVLFNQTGLVVLACILSLPFHIFLSGALFMVLCIIAYIALIVLFTKLNQDYRQYKNSLAH